MAPPIVSVLDTEAVPVTSRLASGLALAIPTFPVVGAKINPFTQALAADLYCRANAPVGGLMVLTVNVPAIVALPLVPNTWKRADEVAVPPIARSHVLFPGERTVLVGSNCQ